MNWDKDLIQASALKEILDNPLVVVVDVQYSLGDKAAGHEAYTNGHLPKSIYLDLEKDLSAIVTTTSGRHPLPQSSDLESKLRLAGISEESHIVVYDDSGGVFAARLWWLCKWLGHNKVSVLDGGLSAWRADANQLECGDFSPRSSGNFVANPQHKLVASVSEVLEAINNRNTTIVDARAPERFRGELEPIDPVAGHVPHAVNVPFQGNLATNGRFKDTTFLSQRHVANESVIHMCGSGVTACHNILASVVTGNVFPKLYVGSWSHWVSDSSRPISTEGN